MQRAQSPPPKPVTELWRPDLVRLPELTPGRLRLRSFMRALIKAVVRICLVTEIRGLENFPAHGPALIVTNHLGDADAVLMAAVLPPGLEALGKIELYYLPVLGKIMDMYGIIWLHRGQPDRRALRAALQGLAEGRMVSIAPEGRESLVRGLEHGMNGAAFLARKAGVPVVPVVLTGTENAQIYGCLRRLQPVHVSLTVGQSFLLSDQPGGHNMPRSLEADTHCIMESLAALLPPEYRGVYSGRLRS